MITTDEELRQAYLSHTRQELPDGHPDAETMWRLAAGELAATESRDWIDHLSRCPACAEDFRLTRQMVAEAVGEAEEAEQTEDFSIATAENADRSVVPFPQRSAGGGWRRFAAAAAMLMVAGGLGWRLSQPTEVIYRQGGEALVQSLLAQDFVAPRSAARLRWSGPEGAVYDLIVTTEALRVIYQAEGLAATEIVIPGSALEALPRATVLRWHVEAVLPDSTRFPSDSFDLHLADE